MAKTQTITTITSARFSVGNGIMAADGRTVAELLNLVAGYGVAHTHFSQHTGQAGWGASGNERATHDVRFPDAAGYVQFYRGRRWIDPDVQGILVRANCTFPAGESGRLRFTIGAANLVLNFGTGTSTQEGVIATSVAGTGWLNWTLELDHQVGAGAAWLNRWLFRNEPITAANLPGPAADDCFVFAGPDQVLVGTEPVVVPV